MPAPAPSALPGCGHPPPPLAPLRSALQQLHGLMACLAVVKEPSFGKSLAYWQGVLSSFFRPDAVFRLSLAHIGGKAEMKVFDIPTSLLPRFLHALYDSVYQLFLHILDACEYVADGEENVARVLADLPALSEEVAGSAAALPPAFLRTPPPRIHVLDSHHARLALLFADDSSSTQHYPALPADVSAYNKLPCAGPFAEMAAAVAHHGRMRAVLDDTLLIASFEFVSKYVTAWSNMADSRHIYGSHTLPDSRCMPISISNLVNEFGIPLRAMRMLEIMEIVDELDLVMDRWIISGGSVAETMRDITRRHALAVLSPTTQHNYHNYAQPQPVKEETAHWTYQQASYSSSVPVPQMALQGRRQISAEEMYSSCQSAYAFQQLHQQQQLQQQQIQYDLQHIFAQYQHHTSPALVQFYRQRVQQALQPLGSTTFQSTVSDNAALHLPLRLHHQQHHQQEQEQEQQQQKHHYQERQHTDQQGPNNQRLSQSINEDMMMPHTGALSSSVPRRSRSGGSKKSGSASSTSRRKRGRGRGAPGWNSAVRSTSSASSSTSTGSTSSSSSGAAPSPASMGGGHLQTLPLRRTTRIRRSVSYDETKDDEDDFEAAAVAGNDASAPVVKDRNVQLDNMAGQVRHDRNIEEGLMREVGHAGGGEMSQKLAHDHEALPSTV